MNEEQLTDEELKILLTEFPAYLSYVFYHIRLPKPTPLQIRIATLMGEGFDRLILEAARGVGKSWIAAVYATWRILKNKEEKVLIVSASSPKAIEIASFVRRLFIQVPLLNHLEPTKNDRDSILAFDVAGCRVAIAPSVAVSGISGQLAGKRASLVIADDVEIPNNSMTGQMREKLLVKVQEFEALLTPDMPSNILYLGTPQSMESIYNKLPYRTVIFPAQVPEDEMKYNGKLDPWIMKRGPVGTPTDSVRFTMDILNQRKAGYGLSGYMLQYMLDTTMSDQNKYPLKFKDLLTYSLNSIEAPFNFTYSSMKDYVLPELPNMGFANDYFVKPLRVDERVQEYDTKIMAIDPSGQGSDETTYAILGVLNGFVHLIDVGGTREGYSDKALLILANKAAEHKVHSIVLEKNFGGGIFTKLFELVVAKIHPCNMYDVTSKGQKEIRIINAVEPLSSNHKFVINYEIVEREFKESENDPNKLPYTFCYQYTHLTRDRKCLEHDDRLDAVAIGCEYIKDMFALDSDNNQKRIEEEEFERWLNEKVWGSNSTQNTSFIN